MGEYRPETDEQMEQFRNELRGIDDPHFKDPKFRFEELEQDDKAIYDKMKQETITEEEFDAYTRSLPPFSAAWTRHTFRAYVANKIFVLLYKRNKLAQLKKIQDEHQ